MPAVTSELAGSPFFAPASNIVPLDEDKQDDIMPAFDANYVSDDKEDEDLSFNNALPPPRYNLCSRANLVDSQIDPSVIPCINVSK